MKRRIVLILIIAIIGMFSITALAAEGGQEKWDSSTQTGTPYYNGEKMSIEGMVELTAGGVELKGTDGKEYKLMYPRFLAEDVQVRDGQTVAVEGYLVPGPRWESIEDDTYLRVEKVTLNGKEYDLASTYGPQNGCYGPGARGRGMRGGQGYRW